MNSSRLFVSALLIGIFAFPAIAPAITIEELQAQVKDLVSMIARLQTQIAQLADTPKPSTPPMGLKHRICAALDRDLAQGIRGEDVQALQEFLAELGFFPGSPTGYFGPLTAQAVAKWQTGEGVAAIGKFGPISRERLLKWCGKDGIEIPGQRFSAEPKRGDAPLTVVFSSWIGGLRGDRTIIAYAIDFGDGTSEKVAGCYSPLDYCQSPGQNKHTYAQNGTYIATLYKTVDPCPTGNSNAPHCLAAVHREVIGKVQITVGPIACTKEYRPVCGAKPITCITTPCNPIQQTYSNKCALVADGAKVIHEGECRGLVDPAQDPQCKRWSNAGWCSGGCHREVPGGQPLCVMPMCAERQSESQSERPAQCLEYFDGSGSKPPVISGFSGPTTLRVNETGTWSIRASDPENGELRYNLTWGDESRMPPVANMSSGDGMPYFTATTFTHTYGAAGVYTITIIVSDTAGRQSRTTTTVRVGEGLPPIACTMEYAPVCGRPLSGCEGYNNTAVCAEPQPVTYGNRCALNGAGATFLYEGECSNAAVCPANAMLCPNGSYVGRTGPNCQFVCPAPLVQCANDQRCMCDATTGRAVVCE